MMEHVKTLFVWAPLSVLVVLLCPALIAIWAIRVRYTESAARRKRPAAGRAPRHRRIRMRRPAVKALRFLAVMTLFTGLIAHSGTILLDAAADTTAQPNNDFETGVLCVAGASLALYVLARLVEAGSRVLVRRRRRLHV